MRNLANDDDACFRFHSNSDKWFVVHTLRRAATSYDETAEACAEANARAAFEMQARVARRIADQIEQEG